MRVKETFRVILLAFLFAFAVGSGLHYGRVGFMPLDHSVVFDGGWRILCGQVPFRDFTFPYGLVTYLMQAFFFKVLGVNWFAYCLHAALLNGLFCLSVFSILRLLRATFFIAYFYALLSALLFYPPVGCPFMDNHAFFFSLIALNLAILCRETRRTVTRVGIWFAIPGVALLGYLSKQIPTLFVVPIILVILYADAVGSRSVRKMGIVLSLGAVFSIGALSLVAHTFDVDYSLVRLYSFSLPSELGEKRISDLPFWILLRDAVIFALVYLPVLLYLVFFLFLFRRERIANTRLSVEMTARDREDTALRVFLIVSLLLAMSLFMLLTVNQEVNAMSYTCLSLGIVHILCVDFMRKARSEGEMEAVSC